MARRKADPATPIAGEVERIASEANAAIADVTGDDDPDAPDALPKRKRGPYKKRRSSGRGPGRPRKGIDAAREHAETETRMMLTVAAGALGETLFHGLAKIESPRWESTQAEALGNVWTPYVVERMETAENPLLAPAFATIAIVSPFVIAALQTVAARRTSPSVTIVKRPAEPES